MIFMAFTLLHEMLSVPVAPAASPIVAARATTVVTAVPLLTMLTTPESTSPFATPTIMPRPDSEVCQSSAVIVREVVVLFDWKVTTLEPTRSWSNVRLLLSETVNATPTPRLNAATKF